MRLLPVFCLPCFNPCFLRLSCNPPVPPTRVSQVRLTKVSILVFLDSPATLGLAHRTFSVCCFNPCFPGLSCNGDKTVIIPFENVFQSLFSWTLLQLGYKNRVGQTLLYRFNPCFPGLSCNSISMTSAVRWLSLSFNPCFLRPLCNLLLEAYL